MDLTQLSDIDLQALSRDVGQEQLRRASLASAVQRVEEINREVLAAEGIKDGDEWRQPTGAHDAYPKGSVVRHGGLEYTSLMPANVLEPGKFGGWKVTPVVGAAPEWAQPVGTVGMYQIGDRVAHNGKAWVSVAANNVWEPGVFGWKDSTNA